jgi:hypothetical protein
MVGRATLTMVVSATATNEAVHTTTRVPRRLGLT